MFPSHNKQWYGVESYVSAKVAIETHPRGEEFVAVGTGLGLETRALAFFSLLCFLFFLPDASVIKV